MVTDRLRVVSSAGVGARLNGGESQAGQRGAKRCVPCHPGGSQDSDSGAIPRMGASFPGKCPYTPS